MTDDRCAWSDLHPWECAHCGPQPAPTAVIVVVAKTVAEVSVRPYLRPTTPRTGRALPEKIEDYRLPDYVAALCDWTRSSAVHDYEQRHRNGSVTTYVTRHNTTSPPLIQQLWQAAEKSRGMDSGSRAFGSQPSAALEALDVANDIDREVHQALRHDHGLANSHDTWPETIDAVRHLGSIANPDEARTIRRWWATARVVTGWDQPAFKPNNTCPICGRRGGLRIKVPTAYCVECRSHWTDETLGLLSEHIRAENHEDDETDTPSQETA